MEYIRESYHEIVLQDYFPEFTDIYHGIILRKYHYEKDPGEPREPMELPGTSGAPGHGPGPPRGRPWDPWGPPMDHNNDDVSMHGIIPPPKNGLGFKHWLLSSNPLMPQPYASRIPLLCLPKHA